MEHSGWRISAFGDEVSNDLHEQLRVLRSLQIGFLELRGVWGKNVLLLSDDEVSAIVGACRKAGIAVSAIGSPVGKSPITLPIEAEMANLARIFTIAEAVGTHTVRVFSFYPPQPPQAQWREADLVAEAIVRLAAMTEAAKAAGMVLVMENERGIVGDTVERCHMVLDAVQSPHLGFAWDPDNFVTVGELTAVSTGWDLLGARIRHLHIKDHQADTGNIVVAGQGDGQISLLLQRLAHVGYDGFLALEPHLLVAGQSSGFSGAEGMERATVALRALLAQLELPDRPPFGPKGQLQ